MYVVEIPQIRMQTNLMQCTGGTDHGGYGAGGDYHISSSYVLARALCETIKEKEMAWVRKKHPDVDFDKIATMLRSGDSEMIALGRTTLSQYTKYTHKMLEALYDPSVLERIINNYLEANTANIGEEVL